MVAQSWESTGEKKGGRSPIIGRKLKKKEKTKEGLRSGASARQNVSATNKRGLTKKRRSFP